MIILTTYGHVMYDIAMAVVLLHHLHHFCVLLSKENNHALLCLGTYTGKEPLHSLNFCSEKIPNILYFSSKYLKKIWRKYMKNL